MATDHLTQELPATESFPPLVSQDSQTPHALTIVLSVGCGVVATCILLTIIILVLRQHSCKAPFRQGNRTCWADRTISWRETHDGEKSPYSNAKADFQASHGTDDSYLPQDHDYDQDDDAPPLAYPKVAYISPRHGSTPLPMGLV
ncbi:hypothetical protein BC834DRAFT_974323 [Gloeopeniophorella convolvens]|nr:hypothetical protein BC834DRAFT_974323 [Gloeopeniophorella convolvens]